MFLSAFTANTSRITALQYIAKNKTDERDRKRWRLQATELESDNPLFFILSLPNYEQLSAQCLAPGSAAMYTVGRVLFSSPKYQLTYLQRQYWKRNGNYYQALYFPVFQAVQKSSEKCPLSSQNSAATLSLAVLQYSP